MTRSTSAFRSLVGCALVAATLTACNVIVWQRNRLENGLRGEGLESTTAQLGEDTVSFWSGGSGSPVLLIHGFGASAIWQWHEQVSALAANHRLVIPDLLWFGGSSSTEPDHSLDHQVRAFVRLLDHLGLERVDVVGCSYGGLVAFELARAHSERVRRLVLVDSPGPVYQRADLDLLLERLGVSHLGEILVPADEAGVAKLIDIAYADPPWTPRFAQRQVLETLYADHRREKLALIDAVVADMEALKERPLRQSHPTLLVWGRSDPIFPVEIGERLAVHLNARLEIIERARHGPNLEHSDEFNALVVEFLADNVPRPPSTRTLPRPDSLLDRILGGLNRSMQHVLFHLSRLD